MKDSKVIGRTVSISIPAGGVLDLLAKVDTGADGSSIWASNISEEAGVLRYCLLGPESDKYTGQVIETSDYSFVRVKNSFGESERRYRVRLTVKIEGRKVRARFSLANRELKSYPALIGRRLLHKKFTVDVSKYHKSPINRSK